MARPVWTARLSSDGLGGLAAAKGVVIAGCRDVTDSRDVFYCLDAATGQVRWQFQYAAAASFDYGNSPRATPVIGDGHVWTMGAAGHVHCLDLATGAIVWQKNVAHEFKTPRLEWGLTGSPLLIDGKLIVQPGGFEACLVALEASTGDLVWKTGPGLPGHSSFITARVGSSTQIVGYDEASLGGWNLETGERLWGIVPRVKGDFNVPTPLHLGDLLVAATENNGTRTYRFDATGIPAPTPTGQSKNLTPDSSSPVAIGNRVFGLTDGLFCLDASSALKQHWLLEHDALIGYGALIACPAQGRVLVLTLTGRLLLVQDEQDHGRVVSDLPLAGPDGETHSHPAIVGGTLYFRIADQLSALNLLPTAADQ